MRNQYKLLAEKYVNEISYTTLARAAAKAQRLNRPAQAQNFTVGLQNKIRQLVGGDPTIIFQVPGQKVTTQVIRIGAPNDPKVEVKNEQGKIYEFTVNSIGNLKVSDEYGYTYRDAQVDRQGRMKLIKLFRAQGVFLDANNINIIGEEGEATVTT